jgi:hypothetical protein
MTRKTKTGFVIQRQPALSKGGKMARIKSEGYGAEWIEVPDEVLRLFGIRPSNPPEVIDKIVFKVSRSGELFECALFVNDDGTADGINIAVSASLGAGEVPHWICFGGVPQYLFDNQLKEAILCGCLGHLFFPKITEN